MAPADNLETNAEVQKLLERFSNEAEEDYIGLWEVVSAIELSPSLLELVGGDLRRAVLDFVQEMLGDGFVAVDLRPEGKCAPWADQRPAEVVQRLEQGWAALGRTPNIGELAWFNKPN